MAIQTLNDLATLLEQRTKINANFAELESTKLSSVPVATTSVLGGVKVGSGLAVAGDGTLSASGTTSPNATTTTPGIVQLAGDLGGTATSPTVPGLTGKQATLVSGTNIKTVAGQSLVGSGAVTLAKADVGLPNVDNTSDASKPVSTAQAVSIATRAPRANGGGALGATRTTTDADDALNFTAPVACTITVHPGAVQGFGFGVSGPGTVTWAGGAGVTVADKRNAGATNPVCGLAYMGANSYEVWGSKT
jgi:hypothetical protein